MTTTDVATGAFVDAGGIKTHYHDVGTGRPVLLLHGSGPGVSAWANWSRTIPFLATQFRVIALDVVGFGFTARPAEVTYGVRTWVDHVWAFMDALGIERASVVGNSMGGRLAIGMATERPERVQRLVLMGSGGIKGEPTPGLRQVRDYEPSLENMRRLLTECFAYDPSLITDELVQARYEASAAPGAHEAYHAMFFDPKHKGNEMAIEDDQIRRIAAPTLIVHGREDKVVPVENAWRLLSLIDDAELHVLGRCGHWTQIEHAERFNDLVAGFFSG